jgi:hypothetical protein
VDLEADLVCCLTDDLDGNGRRFVHPVTGFSAEEQKQLDAKEGANEIVD